ncbi:MAG: hypothetical protein ACR2LA_05405 [Acidimicrobiales bacterium]
MLRRRSASSGSTPLAGPRPSEGAGLIDDLAERGWVLPPATRQPGPPHWTLVGTVASPTATAVDGAGLVVGEGWSLDWWIGADDRWHLPATEAAVRQHLVDDAPVVETLVRVPGGDAAHRAYGFRSPRAVGDEWVAVEIENQTPVPFAVALVVRPLVADGAGAVGHITVEPTSGGRSRDVAHLVRVDGRPAVVLPRRPARLAAGNGADGDVVATVTGGGAGTDLVEASCPDGLATIALVFALPHTAVLRAVVPVGDVGGEPPAYPGAVPDAATVASGWDLHRRGPRLVVPDQRLAAAVSRARAQVQLAHDGAFVRRDGSRAPDLEPGATEVLLGALDVLDRPSDVATVVARWPDRAGTPSLAVDALVLDVVARHWLLHRDDALLGWLLPEVSAGVERLDRAERRGRLTDPAERQRTAVALAATARMLAAASQPAAAEAVIGLSRRLDSRGAEPSGDDTAWTRLEASLASQSPTGTAPGPGPNGRPIGHDLAAAAAVVLDARTLLVADGPDRLAMMSVLPESWYGGGVELHDAPTEVGRFSFALRWHGRRPALLWDLAPHEGQGPVRLTAPGLDRTWSCADARGEALLAEVAPPDGLDTVRVLAEHPEIDPALRRPADAPATTSGPQLEGGSFS